MNATTMTVVAVTGPQELRELQVPIPQCEADDLLIRVAYCGICGSDVPRYFDGAVHAVPQVLGHEFSGTVAACGPQVQGIALGQRVAVAPLLPCHDCAQCLTGHPSLCPNYSFIGSRAPGAMAAYVAVPARNAVPVGNLELRLAALVEPLTVALHAVDLIGSELINHAAVLGGGVIGLMTVLALRDRGVHRITVVDINPWALGIATQFGATATIVARDESAIQQLCEEAPDAVVETAGAPATRRLALEAASRSGRVVFVGTPTADLLLPPRTFEMILRKELSLRGSWMSYSSPFPGDEWERAPRILATASGAESLITHEYPLARAVRGFEAMRTRDGKRLKVLFRVAGQEHP